MKIIGNHLVVGGESYWIALQTAAGVWFAVCETCQGAVLAGPDILDVLKVADFQPAREATATVAPEDIQIGAGE